MRSQCEKHPNIRTKLRPPTSKESCLREIDYVAPDAKTSHHDTSLYIFEDKDAVVKDVHQRQKSDDETRFTNLQSGS